MKQRPIVLSIAGFDPSGRAGLLADGWAITKAGGRMVGAVTALTAQGARFHCQPVDERTLARQLEAVLHGPAVAAIKVGMVPSRRALSVISGSLGASRRPVVIDPVVRTSKGQPLSSLVAGDYLSLGARHPQLVLTPNRDELRWLGVSADDLLELGYWAVVVKGSQSATDEVFSRDGHHLLAGKRIPRGTSNHRGTGCRFASGLATALALDEDLLGAARTAKRLVRIFLKNPIIA